MPLDFGVIIYKVCELFFKKLKYGWLPGSRLPVEQRYVIDVKSFCIYQIEISYYNQSKYSIFLPIQIFISIKPLLKLKSSHIIWSIIPINKTKLLLKLISWIDQSEFLLVFCRNSNYRTLVIDSLQFQFLSWGFLFDIKIW